jgi:hypothetical protein
MPKAKDRNYGCRIKDDLLYKGIRTIVLENDLLRIGLLLGKGSDIYEFLYKPKDLDFIWLSPFGINRPSQYLLTKNQPGGRFMDFYEGGWQEIFPNGGGPSNFGGADFGQHDEVALLPWDIELIEDDPERIEVKIFTNTRLTPLRIEKYLSMERGNPELRIFEKAFNLSNIDMPVIWGHHLVYGEPFLGEDCRIDLSAEKGVTYDVPGVMDDNIELDKEFKWPHLPTLDGGNTDLSLMPPQDTSTSKFLYLSGLDRGYYGIENKHKDLKITVDWDHKLMPYVWFWQEFNKTANYPWYGMSRVFGLEPFSTDTMGLENTIKRKKEIIIKGRSEIEFSMNISVRKL